MRIAADIWDEFAQRMEEMGPFEDAPSIAVALSGGADSKALLLLCREWFRRNFSKFSLTALLVDHMLRAESSREAAAVQEFCRQEGIICHILSWRHDGGGKSMAKAREARYELLTNYCLEHDILHLFVGQNANDQGETLLINLLRGTGIKGLTPMRMISNMRGIRILRPLLWLTKARITELLRENNIAWVEDPSNINDKYRRSRVRKFLQEEEVPPERLLATMQHMKQIDYYINQEINRFILYNVRIFFSGYIEISNQAFKLLEEELAKRILSRAVAVISDSMPREASIISSYQKIMQFPHKKTCLPGCIIQHNSHNILIYKNNNQKATEEIRRNKQRRGRGSQNMAKEIIFSFNSQVSLEKGRKVLYISSQEQMIILKSKYSLCYEDI